MLHQEQDIQASLSGFYTKIMRLLQKSLTNSSTEKIQSITNATNHLLKKVYEQITAEMSQNLLDSPMTEYTLTIPSTEQAYFQAVNELCKNLNIADNFIERKTQLAEQLQQAFEQLYQNIFNYLSLRIECLHRLLRNSESDKKFLNYVSEIISSDISAKFSLKEFSLHEAKFIEFNVLKHSTQSFSYEMTSYTTQAYDYTQQQLLSEIAGIHLTTTQNNDLQAILSKLANDLYAAPINKLFNQAMYLKQTLTQKIATLGKLSYQTPCFDITANINLVPFPLPIPVNEPCISMAIYLGPYLESTKRIKQELKIQEEDEGKLNCAAMKMKERLDKLYQDIFEHIFLQIEALSELSTDAMHKLSRQNTTCKPALHDNNSDDTTYSLEKAAPYVKRKSILIKQTQSQIAEAIYFYSDQVEQTAYAAIVDEIIMMYKPAQNFNFSPDDKIALILRNIFQALYKESIASMIVRVNELKLQLDKCYAQIDAMQKPTAASHSKTQGKETTKPLPILSRLLNPGSKSIVTNQTKPAASNPDVEVTSRGSFINKILYN